jgi:hypothetical protein
VRVHDWTAAVVPRGGRGSRRAVTTRLRFLTRYHEETRTLSCSAARAGPFTETTNRGGTIRRPSVFEDVAVGLVEGGDPPEVRRNPRDQALLSSRNGWGGQVVRRRRRRSPAACRALRAGGVSNQDRHLLSCRRAGGAPGRRPARSIVGQVQSPGWTRSYRLSPRMASIARRPEMEVIHLPAVLSAGFRTDRVYARSASSSTRAIRSRDRWSSPQTEPARVM